MFLNHWKMSAPRPGITAWVEEYQHRKVHSRISEKAESVIDSEKEIFSKT